MAEIYVVCELDGKGKHVPASLLIADLQSLPIKELVIGRLKGTEAQLQGLLQAIGTSTTLTSLVVTKDAVSSQVAASLIQCIQPSSSISSIKMTVLTKNYPLEVVQAIAFLLSINKKVRSIIIEISRIGRINLQDKWFNIARDLCEAIKNNKTLVNMELELQGAVAAEWIDDAFADNATLLDWKCSNPLIQWYTLCNKICHKLGANIQFRNSIPKNLKTETPITSFIQQLMSKSSEWRAMKLVVLGHGRIGKTTLLSVLHSVVDPQRKSNEEIVSTVGIDCSSIVLANGEVMVWDFGGQIEYTTTHQFFLSVEMVMYLVCFDLSKPLEEQQDQIFYWLDFLNSALPLPADSSRYTNLCKWNILLVGLKEDLCATSCLQPQHLKTLLQMRSRLPIYPKLLNVSAIRSLQSVRNLLSLVEEECNRILDKHASVIPSSYRTLLHNMQVFTNSHDIISQDSLFQRFANGLSKEDFAVALQYFHAVGRMVVLSNGLVCTDPVHVPKIASKFISPEEVRSSLLLKTEIVQILDKEQVGYLLDIDTASSERISNEISLMKELYLCFEMRSVDNKMLYLFPSLSSETSTFKFSIPLDNPDLVQAGIRFRCPLDKIFVPGFFCQLALSNHSQYEIYRHEITKVSQNGMAIKCPGLFEGELIVAMGDANKSIWFVMSAYNPDFESILVVFHELINNSFPQYTGSAEEELCPVCIKASSLCISGGSPWSSISIISDSATKCDNLHSVESHVIHPDKEPCWSHNEIKHHFFLNYRVVTEGNKSRLSTEPKFGIVQLLYEQLAVVKRSDGAQIYVYLDRKCLNYGKNWELGFLRGLTNAKVIVLVMSKQGLMGIVQNAALKQDNVYECALLLNLSKGVPVFPVFLAALEESDTTIQYTAFDYTLNFPDAPHARQETAQSIIDKLSQDVPPDKRNFLSTIKSTMQQIFRLQGFSLRQRGENPKDITDLIRNLLITLDRTNTPSRMIHATNRPSFASAIKDDPLASSNNISPAPAQPSTTSIEPSVNPASPDLTATNDTKNVQVASPSAPSPLVPGEQKTTTDEHIQKVLLLHQQQFQQLLDLQQQQFTQIQSVHQQQFQQLLTLQKQQQQDIHHA